MYKSLILLTLLFPCFLSANDKVLHFTISGIIGGGVESFLFHQTELPTKSRVALSTTVAIIPGLAKELMDRKQKGNKFSNSDLAYDAAGALFGALSSALLNKRISMSVEKEVTSIAWSKTF